VNFNEENLTNITADIEGPGKCDGGGSGGDGVADDWDGVARGCNYVLSLMAVVLVNDGHAMRRI
jgi:hypothetical protein